MKSWPGGNPLREAPTNPTSTEPTQSAPPDHPNGPLRVSKPSRIQEIQGLSVRDRPRLNGIFNRRPSGDACLGREAAVKVLKVTRDLLPTYPGTDLTNPDT